VSSVGSSASVGRPAAAAQAWPGLVALAALHAAMFLYDLAHPARFLRADRALERLASIRGFGEALAGGDPLTYLASRGIVGDWLPQGLLYLAGGQYLVIAAQLALVVASVAWVREIGLQVGLPEGRARAAALLYGLLPHTLVFPHQLASEAVFVPLVVLAFRLSLPRLAPSGALALGFATLVRPVTALWPLVQAALAHGPLARRAAFVVLAAAPLLGWMSFVFFATGEFSMGRSGHDLGTNLYWRMQRMGAALPPAERPPVEPQGHREATLGEYLRFVAAHPVAAAAHSARDVVAVTLKSGVERLTLDYLNLFPQARRTLQDSDEGWRADVERDGALHTALALLRAQPWLVLSSALGSLFFAGVLALAAAGFLAALRAPPVPARAVALGLFLLYIVATAQAVDAAQSRHRAPAEFALCVLALAGWTALRRREARQRA
jgi:hypothetical protein